MAIMRLNLIYHQMIKNILLLMTESPSQRPLPLDVCKQHCNCSAKLGFWYIK